MEQNMRIASYIYFSNTAPTDLTQLWAKPVGNDTYSLQIFNNGAWRPLVGSGGKSAYELAVEKGYSGTLEEWLLSLRGVQGNVGPQGEQGAAGPQGPQGEAGTSITDISYSSETLTSTTYIMTFSDGSSFAFSIPKGEKGDKGDTGETGATGPQGEKGDKGDKGDTGTAGTNGTNGTNGTDGIDGEDAYQPFKGWFDSSSDLESVFSSPEVGDYAYVMSATTSDPVAVYYCATAGTWTDSGYEFNPANNQEFLSGESLNTVRIVDDLTTGGATNVLSAKQGKELKGQIDVLGPKIDKNEADIDNLDAVVNGGEAIVRTKIAEDSFMSNVTAGSQQFSIVSGKKYKVHCQSAEPLGQTQLRIYFRSSASDSAISDSYYADDTDISQGVDFELTASATGTALLRISTSGVASAKTLNFEVYDIEEVVYEGILPKVETINGNIDTIRSNTDYLLKGSYAEQGKGTTFDSVMLNESKVREGDTLLINVGSITCPDGASRGAVYLRSYTSDGTRVKNIEIGQNNKGSYTFAETEKIVRIYFFKSVSATSSTSFNYTASVTAYWNQSLRGEVEKVKDDVESINTSISNLGNEVDGLGENIAGKVSRSELGTETSYTPVSPKELLEGKHLNSNGILATVESSSFYVYIFEVKAGDKFNIKGDEYSGASSVRWWSTQATENFSSTPLRVSSSTFADTIDETITIADGEKYLLVGSAYLSATGQTAHITKETEVLPITLTQVKSRLGGLTDFSILNMGVDGDSITEGNQWSYIASGILGCANHHNVGVGGATWACARRTYDGVTYTPQDYSDPNFAGFAAQGVTPTSAEQAQKQANNCAMVHVQRFIAEVNAGTYPVPDIFCFAFGANDNVPSSNDVEAVMAADYTSKPTGEMLYNLAGGMRWALQTIHEEYPNCRIFVLLPIQQAWIRGSVPANLKANMVTKTEYIRRIAQDFSVQIVDMFHNCGIIGCLETTTGPYLRDGLHPNDAGRALMGKYAASQIRVLYF